MSPTLQPEVSPIGAAPSVSWGDDEPDRAARPRASRASRTSFEIQREAAEIMRVADRHARNGQLCIAELQTFLTGTEHEEFLEWLLARRAALFKQFDADDDQDLDVHEIAKAVELYAKELDEKRARGGRKLARIIAHVHRVAAKIRKAGSQDSAVRDNWFGLFKKYDQDGSGNLDYGEVKKVLRKDLKLTPFEVSEADLRVLWMLIDRDGSGLVTVRPRASRRRRRRARARSRARFGSRTTLKPSPSLRFALRSASSRASCAARRTRRSSTRSSSRSPTSCSAARARSGTAIPRATARPSPTRSSRTPRRSRARCTTRARGRRTCAATRSSAATRASGMKLRPSLSLRSSAATRASTGTTRPRWAR